MQTIDGTKRRCIFCNSNKLSYEGKGTVCVRCGELQEKKTTFKLKPIIFNQ